MASLWASTALAVNDFSKDKDSKQRTISRDDFLPNVHQSCGHIAALLCTTRSGHPTERRHKLRLNGRAAWMPFDIVKENASGSKKTVTVNPTELMKGPQLTREAGMADVHSDFQKAQDSIVVFDHLLQYDRRSPSVSETRIFGLCRPNSTEE